eukprot:scaffold2691_cov417-Prasinococcus_capsulatus_cf.AAC.3
MSATAASLHRVSNVAACRSATTRTAGPRAVPMCRLGGNSLALRSRQQTRVLQHRAGASASRRFSKTTCSASTDTLTAAKSKVEEMIKANACAPIMVRLAWHDSGNYDATIGTGGANGSIRYSILSPSLRLRVVKQGSERSSFPNRFEAELAHGGNAGLKNALALLEPIKAEFDSISWADLIQMASAAAIEVSGGPTIDMQYGRVDAADDSAVPPDGRLPNAYPPFQKAQGESPADEAEDQTPQSHLRRVFGRMGLDDREIVALSGAHTLGRAHSSRSGANKMESTKYTKDGPGSQKGGQSWTEEWLKFDNRYFTMLLEAEKGTVDAELLQMDTDNALLTDPAFRPHSEEFAADNDKFCEAYAAAHKKLSELGSTFA